ncbi:MAG: DUF3108 domain-containing protein [Alphaproteobacteria bacterium]|nr:DUF3108 domain-containing protein [Alphaproteobacteria bacterium]
MLLIRDEEGYGGAMKALISGLALGLVGTAALAEPATIEYTLSLGFLGARVAQVEGRAEIGSERYLIETASRNAGVFLALGRGQTLRASGRVEAEGRLASELFTSRAEGGFSPRSVEVKWLPDGTAEAVTVPPPEEDEREAVPRWLTIGTVDLYAAGFSRLIRRNGVEPCAGRVQVFDGRRRYDIEIKAGGDDALKPAAGAVYVGPAKRCLIDIHPVAGYRRGYVEKAREHPRPSNQLWLTPTRDGRFWLPVRLEMEAWWGRGVAHLNRAVIDGSDVLTVLAQVATPSEGDQDQPKVPR